jgi:hypothetical protein
MFSVTEQHLKSNNYTYPEFMSVNLRRVLNFKWNKSSQDKIHSLTRCARRW